MGPCGHQHLQSCPREADSDGRPWKHRDEEGDPGRTPLTYPTALLCTLGAGTRSRVLYWLEREEKCQLIFDLYKVGVHVVITREA